MKVIAVTANESKGKIRIKWEVEDSLIARDWLVVGSVEFGVLSRTCTLEQWIAIWKAVKTLGKKIMVEVVQ